MLRVRERAHRELCQITFHTNEWEEEEEEKNAFAHSFALWNASRLRARVRIDKESSQKHTQTNTNTQTNTWRLIYASEFIITFHREYVNLFHVDALFWRRWIYLILKWKIWITTKKNTNIDWERQRERDKKRSFFSTTQSIFLRFCGIHYRRLNCFPRIFSWICFWFCAYQKRLEKRSEREICIFQTATMMATMTMMMTTNNNSTTTTTMRDCFQISENLLLVIPYKYNSFFYRHDGKKTIFFCIRMKWQFFVSECVSHSAHSLTQQKYLLFWTNV